MSRIAVIGGGITGLSACHYIRRFIPSAQISLFEKNNNYGGWIKTGQLPLNSSRNIPIELGPNSIRGGTQEKVKLTGKLIKDLNLENEILAPSTAASKRYIYYKNKIRDIETFTPILFLRTMFWMPFYQFYLYLRGGHSDRYNDETIEHFFERNVGQKITKILVSSMVNGIYAGGINNLSIKSCPPFNAFKEIEEEHGSYFIGGLKKILQRKKKNDDQTTDNDGDTVDLSKFASFTFNNGLQQFIDALVNDLNVNHDQNVSLYNNFDINSINYSLNNDCMELFGVGDNNNNNNKYEFDHIIIATQPRNCYKFMDNSIKNDLINFNLSSSLITVNIIIKNNEFIKKIGNKFVGFGTLIPRDMNDKFEYNNSNSLLGIIYYSSLFPVIFYDNDNDLNEEYNPISLVLMFGGPDFDENINKMKSNEIVDVCKLKLREMYDINIDENINKDKELIFYASLENRSNQLEMFSNTNQEIYDNIDILYNINCLNNAIDHYKVGHRQQLNDLINNFSNIYKDKVSVIGSGYDGVSIPDCILSAHDCVQNLSNNIGDKKEPPIDNID